MHMNACIYTYRHVLYIRIYIYQFIPSRPSARQLAAESFLKTEDRMRSNIVTVGWMETNHKDIIMYWYHKTGPIVESCEAQDVCNCF